MVWDLKGVRKNQEVVSHSDSCFSFKRGTDIAETGCFFHKVRRWNIFRVEVRFWLCYQLFRHFRISMLCSWCFSLASGFEDLKVERCLSYDKPYLSSCCFPILSFVSRTDLLKTGNRYSCHNAWGFADISLRGCRL